MTNTTSENNTHALANSTATMFPVHHMQKIFLQTSAAQGIAGAFAFAALILTCWQVRSIVYSVAESKHENSHCNSQAVKNKCCQQHSFYVWKDVCLQFADIVPPAMES